MSETREQQEVDPLVKLMERSEQLLSEIPTERKRIKGSQASADVVHSEIWGTLLPLLQSAVELSRDSSKNLFEVRNWAYELAQMQAEHLESVETRLDAIDGNSTQLLPEDAEVLGNVVTACKFLAETFLNGPFPIKARDAEGQAKLHEIVSLCERASEIISENELVADDDDAEEGDDEEGGEGASQ